MPQTRSGPRAATNAATPVAKKDNDKKAQADEKTKTPKPPNDSPTDGGDHERPEESKGPSSGGPKTSKKRSSTSAANDDQPPSKKAKAKSAAKKSTKQATENKKPDQRPRLTTPELEFDFDRSQLRDPRPTPGRKNRPRYSSFELDREQAPLKARLEAEFYIPKPEKPKGRLNAMQKDELFGKESLMNPMFTFHDLHVCHKKGPRGSPTYDDAGFQLDWNKVDNWMHPKPYNKQRMVKGMERTLDQQEADEKQMVEIFFDADGGSNDFDEKRSVMDFLKDHVSKDLGIPWHQIGVEELKAWENKGFAKISFKSWWKKPNKVEKERFSKMLMGGSLRKDLAHVQPAH